MSLESTPKHEEKSGPEILEKMGNMVLARESKLPERTSRVFRLNTALALFLAVGAFSGKAEAQVRGIGPQGGWVRQAVTQTVETGLFRATSAMDKRRGEQKAQLEAAYNQAMHQLKAERSAAYWEHAKGKISEEDYNQQKADAETKMQEVQRIYQEELIKKHGFRIGIFEHILRGVKGY